MWDGRDERERERKQIEVSYRLVNEEDDEDLYMNFRLSFVVNNSKKVERLWTFAKDEIELWGISLRSLEGRAEYLFEVRDA